MPRLFGFAGIRAYAWLHGGSGGRVDDAPLRRDVRLLGDLLGRVLVEQDGESLLEDVERLRGLARAARGHRAAGGSRGGGRELSLERQASVLRAFAAYFQLANVAEQQHRIRRRRVYAHEERVLTESLEESFSRLEGEPPRRIARRVSLELVLTAHPTEAARRTVLAAHLRVGALLAELDDPLLSHARRSEIEAEPRRRSRRSGRRTRCGRGARASSTRSGTGSGSSSRA